MTRKKKNTIEDSGYWMARVQTAAATLSDVKFLAKGGIISPEEVALAQQNYDLAVARYTNPFDLPKGLAA